MSDAWFNSRMFGSGVVSKKDLFELMMRHKPIDNGDGSKERYAYIEWLGIYHAIRELPSADRPQGKWFKDDEGTFICSACGSGYKDQPTIMGKPMFEWCPICGCRMKGADDEDN